jgi:hypothetical protein
VTPWLQAKREFERAYLRSLLEAANGCMSEASRLSGIERRHLYRRLEMHDLPVNDIRLAAELAGRGQGRKWKYRRDTAHQPLDG